MAAAEPKPVTSQHHCGAGSPKPGSCLLFQLLLAPAHTELNWPCTHGWAGKQRRVFTLQGRTVTQGPLRAVARAPWAGLSLLPGSSVAVPAQPCSPLLLLCPPLHLCQEAAVLAGRRASGAVLWGSGLVHPLGRALQ